MRGEKLTEIPAARLVNACRTLAYLALLALMPIDGQATHRVGPNTRFNHLTIEDGLLQNSAIDILQDKTGFIWIATEAGLHRYDGYGFTVFRNDSTDASSLQDNHINVLFEDSHSNVWVGTYAGGLHRFNPATQDFDSFRHDPSNPDSLSNDYVRAVAEDEAGYLWVATFSGLDVLDPNTGSVEHVRVEDETGSLQSEFSPWSIYVDADSRIWVGTVDGLFVYDEKTSTIHPAGNTPQQAEILAKNSASAIVEDFDGTLWIGMYGMLVHLDTERNVSRVYEGPPESGDDLPDGRITSLLVTAKGELWVGTESGGLLQLDRSGDYFNTYSHDPIVPTSLSDNSIYSLMEDRTGLLWIGTQTGGVNIFNPTTRVFRHFEEIGSLQQRENLSFTHDGNILTIEFAAFDFAAPAKNKFRYLLEGFDEDWRNSQGYNQVIYTNLDAGDYVFWVQGANSHGVWSEEEAVLKFTVLPAPWKSWWAYTIYGVFAMFLAWSTFRVQKLRINHQHELEAEQQKRRWAEVLQKLAHSLASSLDAQEVANGLLDNMQKVARFHYAALYIEQGVDLNLLATRGFGEDMQQQLAMMPDSQSKLFERVRHARLPGRLLPEELMNMPFFDKSGGMAHYIAVPTYSRSDEFTMLLVGRDEESFDEEEIRIIASFSAQATVALDNARLFAEVQNLATIDPLTRVNNRRYFFELAELEFSRSKRYKREVAIILLDADKFRDINENYGHNIGDRVLKIIASTCRANLRHFDIIGRYGGEDYIIMLPETPLNIAADIADRLRQAIENIKLDTHLGELYVTVSVGVALATGDVLDLPSLINKADMALYEAKRAGRNRVVVAQYE